jgi:hypothetical protein
VSDKSDLDKWMLFLNKQCSQIGSVVYYDESSRELSNLDKDICTLFKPALDSGKHVFVIVYFSTEKFNEFANNPLQTKLIDLLQSSEYVGRSTLIVITSAQLAKRNQILTQYCENNNSIICIGGKHDSHTRFADVSQKTIGILPGEAYVATSSVKFARVVLTNTRIELTDIYN